MTPQQLHDDAWGRALDTLYAYGVTALYSLIATTAAPRLGLAPRFAPLDRTSFHGDGRYHRAEEPEEPVIHMTRGDSHDQRPALHQGMLDLIVEPQAGIPVLMQPRSGNRSDVHDVGQLITDHRAQWQSPYGTPCLVADRALSRAENLQKLAATRTQWLPRGPATLREAQAVLAHAAPQTMGPLLEDSRSHAGRLSSGGVEQRWGLLPSAPRQPQAPRAVDHPRLQHREQAGKAFKQ